MVKLNHLFLFLIIPFILTGCAGEKTQQESRQQANTELNSQPEPAKEPLSTQNQDSQKSPADQQPPTATPPVKESPPTPTAASPQNYSLQVGDIFPPFTLVDLNGNKTVSAELFSGNKLTLVNFWGTFCSPCIKEMPDLEALRKKYSGQNLGVLGIVLDSNKVSAARDLSARIGTGYPHLLDDGRFGAKIYAVPQTLLVDSSGKVLVSVTGARNLQYFSQMVEPYLE
jgi:thiol-disulfide isomerase/thioredoxin